MNTKGFLLIFISVLTIFSCRKDDICTEGGTPKLIISFYDFNVPVNNIYGFSFAPVLKNVDTLTVVALPVLDTIIYKKALDHIGLPLNTAADNSQFILIKDNNPDTLNFSYTRENVFVSKSCGYKTIFHQLNLDLQQDSDNWIKRIEINNNEIKTDTITHVKIYH